jgi:hypothetical protein
MSHQGDLSQTPTARGHSKPTPQHRAQAARADNETPANLSGRRPISDQQSAHAVALPNNIEHAMSEAGTRPEPQRFIKQGGIEITTSDRPALQRATVTVRPELRLEPGAIRRFHLPTSQRSRS